MICLDKFISVSEMAKKIGVSSQTIHNWIRAEGFFEGLFYLVVRIGRTWLFYDTLGQDDIWKTLTKEDLAAAITTVSEAAKQFGITPSAVRKAIQDGRLAAHKAGGTWIFEWEHACTLWGKTEETEK